jgi:hypothetical protein
MHVETPVAQLVTDRTQTPVAVHGVPAVQAPQTPALQTMLAPQTVPFGAGFPVSVHVGEPVEHVVAPRSHGLAGVHDLPAAHVPPSASPDAESRGPSPEAESPAASPVVAESAGPSPVVESIGATSGLASLPPSAATDESGPASAPVMSVTPSRLLHPLAITSNPATPPAKSHRPIRALMPSP